MSGQGGDGGDLTRATVNLTPRAMAALGELEQRTGDPRTDIINRAVQVLAVMEEQAERAGVTTVSMPWDDDGPLHLKVSRRPFPRWRPW